MMIFRVVIKPKASSVYIFECHPVYVTTTWLLVCFMDPISPNDILCSLQYYEMSYGLNIEMHKQVGTVMFLLFSAK